MNDILKKADCCNDNIYNHEIVSKIMHVLLYMECEKPNKKTNEFLENKLISIKDNFFCKENFPDADRHILLSENMYKMSKYNLVIYVLYLKNRDLHCCPFKSKESITYDGYDFGNQDIIVYNTSTNDFIIMNTFHIHAMYYHNYLGNNDFKIDLEKLKKILKCVPNFKMNISCKNELVYSNIVNIIVNNVNLIRDADPFASYELDGLIVGFFNAGPNPNEYNNFKNIMDLGIVKNSRNGKLQSNKMSIYIFPFIKGTKLDSNPNKLSTIPDYYIIKISKILYDDFRIKICHEHSSWQIGFVSKFSPVMRDIYYYKFEQL